MQLGAFGSGQQGRAPLYGQVKIDHMKGEFFYPDTSHSIGRSIEVIGLGLIRSRTYWGKPVNHEIGMSYPKMCSSNDAVIGAPNMEKFPWEDTSFAKVPSNSRIACDSCPFKGFLHGETQPRCKQSWTIPSLIMPVDASINDRVYLINFTASSIPSLTEYLTPLRDNGIPLYTYVTKVKLNRVSKGESQFTKAEFSSPKTTNQRDHPRYSELLNEVRDNLQPKGENVPIVPLKLGGSNSNL